MRTTNETSHAGHHHQGNEPHLLREILRAYQVLISGFARETGMPASRFGLMRLLAISDDDLGTTDLSRRLDVTLAAVSRQVKELEAEGLVKRRADAKDGRRSYITLSSKGQKLFERIHERTHKLEQSLSSVLGAEEMRNAATVLAKLQCFIKDRR
jgi:DNA-binding MarR family transcriptional regulator